MLRAAMFCAAATILAAASVTRAVASPAQQQQGGAPAVVNPAAQVPPFPEGVVYTVSPAEADPQVKRFLSDNIVIYKHGVAKDAPLMVYFSGTSGTPLTGWLFLEAAAKAGYRVIGLEYDNGSAVPVVCGPNPDPACSDHFRQKRIFGDNVSKDIDDLPEESVVNRLTKMLVYLDAHHHAEGWGQYLRNGAPNWPRIGFAGHSQGGGVAAYIAKKEPVYRVIVLSGAWDRTEVTKTWAAWITAKSATPMTRWYAACHAKESRSEPIQAAYKVLGIPPSHVRVLKLGLNPGYQSPSPNADVYHGSMISTMSTPRDAAGNPAYAADWAFFLGTPK